MSRIIRSGTCVSHSSILSPSIIDRPYRRNPSRSLILSYKILESSSILTANIQDQKRSAIISLNSKPETKHDPRVTSRENVNAPLTQSINQNSILHNNNTPQQQQHHPATWWKQVKHFPIGVKHLYNDYHNYKNIRAASQTPYNAWMGKIPRRQKQQQIQFQRDLRTVFPIVAGYMLLPIVGNIFVIIGIAFPRVLLSRQFHDDDQKRLYATLDYRQRCDHFCKLAQYFVEIDNIIGIDNDSKKDAAGPIVSNFNSLFQIFENRNRYCFESLPKDHLVTLAKTSGINRLPNSFNALFFNILPSFWLKYRVQMIATQIIEDDSHLIEEGYHTNRCHPLTDDEVMMACLHRGLPNGELVNFSEMRECLSNHLWMVLQVRKKAESMQMKQEEIDFLLQMVVLHLPAIRHLLGCKSIAERIND